MFLTTRKGEFQLKRRTMTAECQTRHISAWPKLLFAAVGISQWACSATFAYKGMGDQVGVVQQGVKPPMTQLPGTIVSIKTHPCEKTIGPAVAGTHLIAKGTEGTSYNLHLGPIGAVGPFIELLQPGRQIETVAFRTPQMPENQYVVPPLQLEDGKVLVLRNPDLRRFWSGGASTEGGRNQGLAGYGEGRGFGR